MQALTQQTLFPWLAQEVDFSYDSELLGSALNWVKDSTLGKQFIAWKHTAIGKAATQKIASNSDELTLVGMSTETAERVSFLVSASVDYQSSAAVSFVKDIKWMIDGLVVQAKSFGRGVYNRFLGWASISSLGLTTVLWRKLKADSSDHNKLVKLARNVTFATKVNLNENPELIPQVIQEAVEKCTKLPERFKQWALDEAEEVLLRNGQFRYAEMIPAANYLNDYALGIEVLENDISVIGTALDRRLSKQTS